MLPKQICSSVYAVGAIDWDRRLFDSLIPLPDGTSYNSYLVKGSEKTVLIDTVDPVMKEVLTDNFSKLGVERLDYVVAHHGEQDHSGLIPCILDMYPEAKVICSEKCRDILSDLLLLPVDRFITVADKESISLGDRTLEFIHAPWVHWPETMLSYLREQKILFSCDLFGSHIASSNLYSDDISTVFEASKRYFAEIMMPFRAQIRKHLSTLDNYEIEIIAPSHGPVHNRPEFIVQAYRSWSSDDPKNVVVIPYVSMHGSTKKMVDFLISDLMERGVDVKPFDLTVTDIGKLAMELVDAATIVLGTPTVLTGPHPMVAYAAILANALRPNIKFASIVGSYSWGSQAVDQLSSLIPRLKVELLSPVLSKGYPTDGDFSALSELASTIAAKHKESGFGEY
jgi:flavorubredoxin